MIIPLTAIIQRQGDHFVALCPELDIAGQGNTIEAARDNLRGALELRLSIEGDSPAEIQQQLSGEAFTQVVVDHPMLEDLRRVDREARQRFPPDCDPGLGDVGLILRPTLTHRYDRSTPLNCWTFADPGIAGVQFSFLARDGVVRADSPVVLTVSMAFSFPESERSWIVGEDLFDFLCLGYYRGYFCLWQLAYDCDLTLQACTDLSWEPSEEQHYDVGFGVTDHQWQLLTLLEERFGLRPWPSADRFAYLQRRFAGQLQTPSGLSS